MYTLQQTGHGPHSVLSHPALQQCGVAAFKGQEPNRKRYTIRGILCSSSFSPISFPHFPLSLFVPISPEPLGSERDSWGKETELQESLIWNLLSLVISTSAALLSSLFLCVPCVTLVRFLLLGLASCLFVFKCIFGEFLYHFTSSSSHHQYLSVAVCWASIHVCILTNAENADRCVSRCLDVAFRRGETSGVLELIPTVAIKADHSPQDDGPRGQWIWRTRYPLLILRAEVKGHGSRHLLLINFPVIISFLPPLALLSFKGKDAS